MDQVQNHVEVVDHEVQDDIDVGAAAGIGRKAVGLDEAGMREPFFSTRNTGLKRSMWPI